MKHLTNFSSLPLVAEGESKEVRYAGNGKVIIRLKPTVYSYTHNRNGIVPGSDTLRSNAARILTNVVTNAGIPHSYQQFTKDYIVSELILQPITAQQPLPFRPDDLSNDQLAKLHIAPPIEVVVKKVHTGTPKHRYYQFDNYPTRFGFPDKTQGIKADTAYPETTVRFDWRNPLHDNQGNRLADEVMSDDMANWFIDVKLAKQTALDAFKALDTYFHKRGLELWDICFFITQDGTTLFGEISPDCLRVRAADGSSLDKDIWRSGGSSHTVLEKWQLFVDTIQEKGGK